MLVRIKGVKRVRSKGRTYWYFRRTGERLPDDPVERAQRVLELQGQPRESRAPYGSVAGLVAQYKALPAFTDLTDRTRGDYLRYLSYFEDTFGDLPVNEIDREFVIELRDAFTDTPRKADYLVRILSILCNFALDRPRQYGLLTNPAARVKRIARGDPFMPWPDNLIVTFRKKAYPELVWAMETGLYTAQRLSACVGMTWPHYDGEVIQVEPQKGGNRVWVPAHPDFREVLTRIPRRAIVMLTTKRARPWTPDLLSRETTKYVALCGFEGYTFHGLRKNAARNLAEAGASPHEIASVTGHKTLAMVEHYTREARQRELAKSAIAKLPRKK